MLDLLRIPFELAFAAVSVVVELLGAACRLAWGLVSGVFALLGGFLSLAIGLGSFLLVAGLIVALMRARRHSAASRGEGDDFVSFYAQDGKVE